MDVCDISRFFTLTLCVVVGFQHGFDALDWGMALSLRLWSRLRVVINRHTPHLSILLVGLFISYLSAFSDVTLGHTPFLFVKIDGFDFSLI